MKTIRSLAAALVVLAVAGCASNPPVTVALPGPAQLTDVPQHGRAYRSTVVLRAITLPGYLDSHAIVVGRNANMLIVSNEAEWAERPREAVTRVLRDALAQRVGASQVLLRGEHRRADAELVIEFLKLDPEDGAVQLDARWSFVCTARGRAAHAGRTQLQAPLEAATPAAIATATSNALIKFAEVLATETWCPGRSEVRGEQKEHGQHSGRAMTAAKGGWRQVSVILPMFNRTQRKPCGCSRSDTARPSGA